MRGLLLASTAIALASTNASCSLFGSHPSDASMIRNFVQHRAIFDQLVSMSDGDKSLVRLAPTFTYPENPPGLSAERWQQYRKLFREIGSTNGICRYESDLPGAVLVLYSDKGLVTGGSSKGYVYSPMPLEPHYANLDDPPHDLASNVKAYRRIDERWYIFYEWDD